MKKKGTIFFKKNKRQISAPCLMTPVFKHTSRHLELFIQWGPVNSVTNGHKILAILKGGGTGGISKGSLNKKMTD